jgi:hypothetical protein
MRNQWGFRSNETHLLAGTKKTKLRAIGALKPAASTLTDALQ